MDEAFQLIEYCAQRLDRVDPPTSFSRVTSIIVAKARNLCHCCYSLALDGHAQESGALGRNLLETIELLIYLRQNPSRVDEVLDDRLPSAGERAKRIGGEFKFLRDYWNKHAAHFSFKFDSIHHIFDAGKMKVRTRQEFKESTLRQNMGMFFPIFMWVGEEACMCINEAAGGIEDTIVDRVLHLKEQGLTYFNPELMKSLGVK